MGVRSLDHWEHTPRIESMRRPTMRADESKNPSKFGKARQSLDRLQQHVEMAPTPEVAQVAIGVYRNRLSRALQLSTTPLRIAPGTSELREQHAHAVALSVADYERRRLREAIHETRHMTLADADDIRASVRREIIERKMIAMGKLHADDPEALLAEAEAFVGELDERAPAAKAYAPSPEETAAIERENDERLAVAEEFAVVFDSISRTTHDGASNVELIDLPWGMAGYHSRES